MGAYELLKLLSEAGEKVNDGDEARGVVWRFDQDVEEEIDDYLNWVGCGERRERIVLVDLNSDLHELYTRVKLALESNPSPEETEDVVKETHFFWIYERLDLWRRRYGPQAQLVLVLDAKYHRSPHKQDLLDERYAKEYSQMVRKAAGDAELVGEIHVDRSNQFSKDVGNRRKEVYLASRDSNGNSGIDFDGIARRVYDDSEKRCPPIILPTRTDLTSRNLKIAKLATVILENSTLVRATAEADQAILAYMRQQGRPSSHYLTLSVAANDSSPSSRTTLSSPPSDSSSSPSPRPIYIIEGKDGDLLVNHPPEIQDTFFVSQVTRRRKMFIRLLDISRLSLLPEFPLASSAAKIFAHSIIGSDLSKGTRNLGWKTLLKNKELVILLNDSDHWVEAVDAVEGLTDGDSLVLGRPFSSGGTKIVKSMEELEKLYNSRFDTAAPGFDTRDWTLSHLSEWYKLRSAVEVGRGELRVINKKTLAIEKVSRNLEAGLARESSVCRNHVSITVPPIYSLPVDARTKARFSVRTTRPNPRKHYPLDDRSHPYRDRGFSDYVSTDVKYPQLPIGRYGPKGRRESAPSYRARLKNNGGSINLATALVRATNASFEKRHGRNFLSKAEELNNASINLRRERFGAFVNRKRDEEDQAKAARPGRRAPKKTKTGADSQAGLGKRTARGFRLKPFATRTLSTRLERSFRNLVFADGTTKPGQIRSAFKLFFTTFADYGSSQLQLLFDIGQRVILDYSYYQPLLVTELEHLRDGFVNFFTALASLARAVDGKDDKVAKKSSVASDDIIWDSIGGWRNAVGKETLDRFARELRALSVTEQECKAYRDCHSAWMNPIAFFHLVREKRQTLRSRFRLNYAPWIGRNFTEVSSNFRLSSARHSSTFVKDLARKIVSDCLDLVFREGDFGPSSTVGLKRMPPLFDAAMKAEAHDPQVRLVLGSLGGGSVTSKKKSSLARLVQQYLEGCSVEEDDTDDVRIAEFKSAVRERIRSLSPRFLHSLPDPSFPHQLDLLIDSSTEFFVKVVSGVVYYLRAGFAREVTHANRIEKWRRRNDETEEGETTLADELSRIGTFGRFFAAVKKSTPSRAGTKRQTEEEVIDGEREREFDEDDSGDSEWEDEEDEEDEAGSDFERDGDTDDNSLEESTSNEDQTSKQLPNSVRRLCFQFSQILQRGLPARRFRSVHASLVDFARISAVQTRFKGGSEEIHLPTLVKSYIEELRLGVQDLNRRTTAFERSPRDLHNLPKLSSKVEASVAEINKRRNGRKGDKFTKLQQKFPGKLLIRGVHDLPFVRVDGTTDGPYAGITLDERRWSDLAEAASIVSKVLESFVAGSKRMSFTVLSEYLEDLSGEVSRQVFKVPFRRVLPTGVFNITLRRILHTSVVDPGKLSLIGKSELEKIGLSSNSGWKQPVPQTLARSNKKLIPAYRKFQLHHLVEVIHASQQPPPNESLTRYVSKWIPILDGYKRPLAPLFELVNDGRYPLVQNKKGRPTLKASSRLDWSKGSGVVGRVDRIPRPDVGVEYEDFGPVDSSDSEAILRRRSDLNWINNEADVVIGIDPGQSNLLAISVCRRGESSDIFLYEKKTTARHEGLRLQKVQEGSRQYGEEAKFGRLVLGRNVAPNIESFFSNERKERMNDLNSGTDQALTPLVSTPLSVSTLPSILLNKIRSRRAFDAETLTIRHNSVTKRRLQRDIARQLKRITQGASSVGVLVGHFAKGSGSRLAAGSATESLKCFFNALSSLHLECKSLLVNEYRTSSRHPVCDATLTKPTRVGLDSGISQHQRILECILCRQVVNRDEVGASNTIIVGGSASLHHPSHILDDENTRLREGRIRPPTTQVQHSAEVRDAKIRAAATEREKEEIAFAEYERRIEKDLMAKKVGEEEEDAERSR